MIVFIKIYSVLRLCDYVGKWYCHSCHWGYTSPIPARVLNNWDFTSKQVLNIHRGYTSQHCKSSQANPY